MFILVRSVRLQASNETCVVLPIASWHLSAHFSLYYFCVFPFCPSISWNCFIEDVYDGDVDDISVHGVANTNLRAFEPCRICGIYINAQHRSAMINHMRAHTKNDELRSHMLAEFGEQVMKFTCIVSVLADCYYREFLHVFWCYVDNSWWSFLHSYLRVPFHCSSVAGILVLQSET